MKKIQDPKKNKAKYLIVSLSIFFLIIISIVIGSVGINKLMGNVSYSDKCLCDEGWIKDKNMCYYETKQQNQIDAYLVGDVINEQGDLIPDGLVTLQDWLYIKKEIDSNVALNEYQKLIYDLNGDGVVNNNDIDGYSTSSLGEFTYDKRYVCPNSDTIVSEENDTTTKTTISYKLMNNKCDVETHIRMEKKPVCDQVDDSKQNGDNYFDSLDIDTSEEESEEFISEDEESIPNDIDDEDIVLNHNSSSLNYANNVNSKAIIQVHLIDAYSNYYAKTPNSEIVLKIYGSVVDCIADSFKPYDSISKENALSYIKDDKSLVFKYQGNNKYKVYKKKKVVTFSINRINKQDIVYIGIIKVPGQYNNINIRNNCQSVTISPGKKSSVKFNITPYNSYGKSFVGNNKVALYSNYKSYIKMDNLDKNKWSNKMQGYFKGFYVYNKGANKYLCNDNYYHYKCETKKGYKLIAQSGTDIINKYTTGYNQTYLFKPVFRRKISFSTGNNNGEQWIEMYKHESDCANGKNKIEKRNIPSYGGTVKTSKQYRIGSVYYYKINSKNTSKARKCVKVKVKTNNNKSIKLSPIFKYNNGNYKPKKGDIVFFDWQPNDSIDHVGIVYKANDKDFKTIEGNVDCQGDSSRCCDGCDDTYFMEHSKVSIKRYNNYRTNKQIIGFVSMRKIISGDLAKKLADLAYKQLDKGGKKFWNNTDAWTSIYGKTEADWCAIFLAWVMEKKKINPSMTGWSAYTPTWKNTALGLY